MSVRLLAHPAYANRAANPYNAMLSDALRGHDVSVCEWSTKAALRERYDVINLHWPEGGLAMIRWLRAVQHVGVLLVATAIARRRGAAVVWTAHNLRTHEQRHPRTERVFWRLFLGLVDGWISLSEAAADAAINAFPRLSTTPHAVVPHGHYRGAYPDTVTRDDARECLGLSRDATVVAFIGRAKDYKNVDVLIDAFSGCPGDHLRLTVHGLCRDETLGSKLRERAAGDDRVHLDLTEVEPSGIQNVLRAADLVVLPYQSILNSGSALLALSFDRRVLVPAQGSMVDLQARVGTEWVLTYTGQFTAETLRRMLALPTPEGRPPIEDLSWDVLANDVIALYKQAMERRRAAT